MAYLGRKGASAPLTSADIPAGSISAVKVASDVATQAELDANATASASASNVTSGTLATTRMATGTIIQCVVSSGDSSAIAGNSPNYGQINVAGVITPSAVGTKIYVVATYTTGVFANNSGVTLYQRIVRSGSSVSDAYLHEDAYSLYFEARNRATSNGNIQMYTTTPLAWYDTPGHSDTSSAITYTVYVKGNYVQIHKGTGQWSVQMMEIQQ